MSTITPITPNVPPQPAHAGLAPREGREQQLRIDQVIQATVSEGGQERVWLNIGRQRFLAQTEIPLQTGQRLTLLVSRINPSLEFKVLRDPLGDRIRQNLHLLEGPWSLGELAAILADPKAINPDSRTAWAGFLTLQGVFFEENGDGILTRFLARLGLDYEALLGQGDLAGATATLKRVLEDARNSGRRDPGGDRLEHLAGLFELWQLVRLKLARQGIEFWPLPLPGVEQGFMLAERGEGALPDGAGEDERSWRVTVHLQLAGGDPLRIDFLWERSGLLLRFHCASSEQARLWSGRQTELRRFVKALPLEGVAFSVGAPPPATVLVKLLAGSGVLNERV